MAHVPRNYTSKFPEIQNDPSKKAQYYRERARKAETARHYNPEKILPYMHTERPKPKG